MKSFDGEYNTILPPQAIVMQMVMGAWVSQAISTVTRFNIPDILHTSGMLSAGDMIKNHKVDAKPEFLERLLRACASVGIFTESHEGKFGPTALSDVLTINSPVSIKKMTEVFGGSWWKIWSGLQDAVIEGKPQVRAQLGMDYWDYCKANPKEMQDFSEAMKSNSINTINGILENTNLDGVSTLVDIGGGLGHTAIALLKKYTDLRATVLDLEDLMPIARQHAESEPENILSRLEFKGGDMFESVPIGQVYILKHIIHDWDDESCIRLLRNCYNSMEYNGSIICIDSILPPMGDTSGLAGKFLDLDMMVFNPGKERTLKEWENLYHDTGFRINDVIPLNDNFGTSIIEGIKN